MFLVKSKWPYWHWLLGKSQDCVLEFIYANSINTNYVFKVYPLEICLYYQELNENRKKNFLQFSTILNHQKSEITLNIWWITSIELNLLKIIFRHTTFACSLSLLDPKGNFIIEQQTYCWYQFLSWYIYNGIDNVGTLW